MSWAVFLFKKKKKNFLQILNSRGEKIIIYSINMYNTDKILF